MAKFSHTVHLQVPATATFAARLCSGPGRITYRALRETTGAAAATVELYDGFDTTGPIMDDIAIAQGSSDQNSYQHGLQFENGLYINVVSGTVKGAINVVFEEHWDDYCKLPIVVNIPFDELQSQLAALQGS